MIEWKPIEEAPKDGTWIIVCNARLSEQEFHLSIGTAKFIEISMRPSISGFYDSDDNLCAPTHYAEIGEKPWK